MARQARIGIDFGTTNSALAVVGDDGGMNVARWSADGDTTSVYRSLLFFEEGADWIRGRPPCSTGPEAIEQYLWTGGDGRLMQSMKSFLASRHMLSTSVFGRDFKLEELVAEVVRGLWTSAANGLGLAPDSRPDHIVAGRPVTFAFSNGSEDDAFAEGRLRKGFALAGFDQVDFVFEPVAAAVHYEAALDRDETVLVADFGGGTSDFCLLRVGPGFRDAPTDPARVLSTGGVGVAGDAFDARIVEHVVAPALGRGSRYRSQSGKLLEIPGTLFKALGRWHDLSVLKTPRNVAKLDGYRRMAEEPEKIDALCYLVEADLGYAMYREVQAAKVRLSQEPTTAFAFEAGDVTVEATIERNAFDTWIAPELTQIASALDATLGTAGITVDAVDTVFMTGGTALVPAVRQIFADRFGDDKLRSGDYLTSVASGLATYAAA